MSPETHLFASWIVAAKTTNNLRDCRLVALAGFLPDADGAGILVDMANRLLGRRETVYYFNYHHFLLHGIFGAVVITAVLTCFARERWRVAGLALLMVHLHFLCDFVGSRGPSPEDLWPIFYLGPFSKEPMWVWHGQWELDGWPNRYATVLLFAWALYLAVKRGDSFVGVFNRRLDGVVVGVLQKWQRELSSRFLKNQQSG